jgi:hypothetical protein
MNKVDSLMFPSEDPFAYPNQPMMELGYQDKSPQMSMAGQASDANFFLTSPLDDLDSQLLGQPPPYMMHQPQGATGMGMSPTLYDPGNLLGLHVDDQPQQSQQQPPPQPSSACTAAAAPATWAVSVSAPTRPATGTANTADVLCARHAA